MVRHDFVIRIIWEVREHMPRAILLTAIVMTCSLGSAPAQVVNVWPGAAPGSENWTQKEMTVANTPIGAVTLNVVTPTLTAFFPERTKASGASVIIAPGGAFVALAM